MRKLLHLPVALLVITACGPVVEDVSLLNPVDPSQLDDTVPAPSVYDASLTYVSHGVSQNHSTDRYRFDIAAYQDDAQRVAFEKLYPSHAAFLDAHHDAIPSVQTIGTYTKQLDDTVYAGVELAMQKGLAPTVKPKTELLLGALAYLSAHRSADADTALVAVAAALELGGATPVVPAELTTQVDAAKTAFLADPYVSKPFGFYTWSDSLKAIWQQDRLLQQPFVTNAPACALAQAIGADDARKAQYLTLVSLYGKLTNPLHSSLADLLPIAADPSCATQPPHAFLSSSATVEVALFEKLYPDGIPPNANLMQDLVDAIRKGTVDLRPKADDGWYQYQEFALETLLVTDKAEERSKIGFTATYKKRLQEAFETMLVQHRETHAKQADSVGLTSAIELPTTPVFRAEPLATVYVRHARSYVFLEAALDQVLGAGVLDQAYAVSAGGPATETLRTRIRRTRDLFFGLYLTSCQDVGLAPKLGEVGDPSPAQRDALAADAATWLDQAAADPLMKSDVRVMIPIAQIDDKHARFWAVVGVRGTMAGYSFIKDGTMAVPKVEDQSRVALPTEQFLEVTSSNTPMSRDEFRALCDQNGTVDAIKAALEARQ